MAVVVDKTAGDRMAVGIAPAVACTAQCMALAAAGTAGSMVVAGMAGRMRVAGMVGRMAVAVAGGGGSMVVAGTAGGRVVAVAGEVEQLVGPMAAARTAGHRAAAGTAPAVASTAAAVADAKAAVADTTADSVAACWPIMAEATQLVLYRASDWLVLYLSRGNVRILRGTIRWSANSRHSRLDLGAPSRK